MRWLVILFFCFLLWVSLTPFMAKIVGDPEKAPFKVLSKDVRMDPLEPRWAYYLAQAYRAIGEKGKAGIYYFRALRLNPLDPLIWSSLADLYLDEGKGEEALGPLGCALRLDPSSAFVQWQALTRLLSIDTPEARKMARGCISRLLFLEPSKRRNLFALGRMLAGGGGLEEMLPSREEVWMDYFKWLVSEGEVDNSVRVWGELRSWGWANRDLFKVLMGGLIRRGAMDRAGGLWMQEFPGGPLIHNGGFEKDLLGFGFGWRWHEKIPGLKSWGFSYRESMEGRRSFYMEFDGEHNPQVSYPRQLVYVDTPGNYRLSAFIKTEGVTGATGFSLVVWGKGLREASEEMRGYTSWRRVSLPFKVDYKGPLWVGLVRRATGKFNRFLGGWVWLDQVALEKVDGEEALKGSPE
jgi:hypothetical protein